MKKIVFIFMVIWKVGWVSSTAWAAGPPGPPGGGGGGGGSNPPCWPPPCVPIDGGIVYLMTAGMAIGVYRYLKKRPQ